MPITVKEFVALGWCPHVVSAHKCDTCQDDPSQLSYSWQHMANLTHEVQVAVFGWCGCEDNEGNENPYKDCPTH